MTRISFENISLDLTSDGRHYATSLVDRSYQIELIDAVAGRLDLLVDNRHIVAYVSQDTRGQWVTVDGRTFRLNSPVSPERHLTTHRGPSELTAPMPGQVRAVNASAGDIVTRGQLLVVLEAMKMEIRLSAPFDAEVISLETRVGQTVERDQIIARLQPR